MALHCTACDIYIYMCIHTDLGIGINEYYIIPFIM